MAAGRLREVRGARCKCEVQGATSRTQGLVEGGSGRTGGVGDAW